MHNVIAIFFVELTSFRGYNIPISATYWERVKFFSSFDWNIFENHKFLIGRPHTHSHTHSACIAAYTHSPLNKYKHSLLKYERKKRTCDKLM